MTKPARPRVLFISHETTLSGASMQLLHLIIALNEQGWQAVLAAPEPGSIVDLLERTETRVELDKSLLLDPNHKKLRALCREFDVVVANTIASWPAVYVARREKIPVIWYLHETRVAAQFMEQHAKMRPVLRDPDRIVVPSQQTAELLYGVVDAKIEVVPYGIPNPGDRVAKKESKATSFIALGSFELGNGQDVLLDSIGRLDSQTRRKVSFKIAGPIVDRQFFAEVRKRAARLENVELIDSLSYEETIRLLANSDAVISSSRDETMSITIIEAASLGKAIITTAMGGIAEWIHDRLNGLLVPAENSSALAKAITQCAQDRQLLEQLGSAARRTYERHFTLDRFTNEFVALLEEVSQPEVPQPFSMQREYERWFAAFDRENGSSCIALSRRVRRLPRHPLISVLLPVYNPDLGFLRAAIDSVKNQIYPCWELCIADDASTNPEVRQFLEQITCDDSRIKTIFREENGHISACSNSALALATGEWCALLDQDDALSESAFAYVAQEIADHPDAGLIYSDEDKIDNHGARSNPFFKTDWNPQLFLSQNYINHLGVYRTALMREIGGFREGFKGSQDYDLTLRCVEKLRPEQVRHISRILYHWRMAEGSLAAVPDAKPYAKEAARRAIGDHLKRCGIAARVVPCPENIDSHRVIYEVGDSEPLVSILIPTRDRIELLKQCMRSLEQEKDYSRREVIIIDNDSAATATRKYLRELETSGIARILPVRGPFNFSRLTNRGADVARGELLAPLNNDIEANESGWLREMVSHAIRPEVGAVGARLWYPNGGLQHGGVVLGFGGVAGQVYRTMPRGRPGYFNRAFLQQNYSCVTAACMVLRKKVFVDVGGFDEVNLAVSFNDVDFCLKILDRGLQIVWTPYANLIHHESASRGYQRTRKDQMLFNCEVDYMQQRWGSRLLCDPFYSPNLSLHLPGFELAFPPRRTDECFSVA
jgi:glycosyltransferase involved in cell wall biosynthesis